MAEAAARSRLASERKLLLESKPAGCFARPVRKKDGSVDLFLWEGGITPAPSSVYALPQSGAYRLFFEFKPEYPATPPLVRFSPPIFHTNCFPNNGLTCLSLLLPAGHHPGANHKGHWQASLTIGELLKALQIFLDEPNANSVCVCRTRACLRRPPCEPSSLCVCRACARARACGPPCAPLPLL